MSLIRLSFQVGSCSNRELMLYCLLLICLLITLSTFATHVYRNIGLETGLLIKYNSVPQMCLPCSNIARHPDDGLVGIDVINDGTECCAKDVSTLHNLVDRYTLQWFKEFLYRENFMYSTCVRYTRPYSRFNAKPTGKQFIKLVGVARTSRRKHGHVHWDIGRSLVSKNIAYHHGYIHIRVPGVYYVYSQIAIDYRPGTSHSHVRHTIAVKKRYSDAQEWEMVVSNTTKCSNGGNDDMSVSFIGTSYILMEGDRLFVKLSSHANVLFNSKMDFFGVHMI